MYIYLSDQKRRMYLCLTLPQNLSSKKLSVKDLGFLQKTIRNDKSLSFALIKQQKLLYEKHILKTLNFSEKFDKEFALYFCVWQKSENYNTLLPKKNQKCFYVYNVKEPTKHIELQRVQDNQTNLKKTTAVSKPLSVRCFREQDSKVLIKNNLNFLLKKPKENISFLDTKKTQKTIKKNIENNTFKTVCSDFSNGALCVYVQKIKTPFLKFKFYPEPLQIIKNLYLDKFFDIKQFVFPPLFANGKNRYLYSRYLYMQEHIKTSINPQVYCNPMFVNRTKILHEKKKICLFYGFLAKKDMYVLCNNAKKLPGIFADNMYTLLESRIDVLVYRAGFAKTIPMARQLIRKGLFFLNGKKICSCKILGKPGDIFTYSKNKFLYNCYIENTKTLYQKVLPYSLSMVSLKKKIFVYKYFSEKVKLLSSVSTNPGSKTSHPFFGLRAFSVDQSFDQSQNQNIICQSKFSTFNEEQRKKSLIIWQKKTKVFCPWLDQKSFLKQKSTFKGRYVEYKVDKHGLNALNLFTNESFLYKFFDVNKTKSLNILKQNSIHYLYTGFLLYQNLCKKQPIKHYILKLEKNSNFNGTSLKGINQPFDILDPYLKNKFKTNRVYINVYCAFLLKYKTFFRNRFYIAKDKEKVLYTFMKNIQNANCVSIWGQKPLHLEISHKTTAFIYLYRPQKLISPLLLDFSALT